jgi:hypothetical protein
VESAIVTLCFALSLAIQCGVCLIFGLNQAKTAPEFLRYSGSIVHAISIYFTIGIVICDAVHVLCLYGIRRVDVGALFLRRDPYAIG